MLAGCVHHLPKYPRGTMVVHTLTGREGQIAQWWCRTADPCQYLVRFPVENAPCIEEHLFEFEIVPVRQVAQEKTPGRRTSSMSSSEKQRELEILKKKKQLLELKRALLEIKRKQAEASKDTTPK